MSGDPDDTECVNYKGLRDMLTTMTDLFSKNQTSTDTTLEWVQRGIADVVGRVEALEARLPAGATNVQQDGELAEEDDEPDEFPDFPCPPPCRQLPNRHGIGGNINRPHPPHVRHDDPFAKVKFSIPPFYGAYDAEAYLNWEMTLSKNLVLILFLNNMVLDKPLMSLKILLLSGGMSCLTFGCNLIHGIG